jgi:hypothetical protein
MGLSPQKNCANLGCASCLCLQEGICAKLLAGASWKCWHKSSVQRISPVPSPPACSHGPGQGLGGAKLPSWRPSTHLQLSEGLQRLPRLAAVRRTVRRTACAWPFSLLAILHAASGLLEASVAAEVGQLPSQQGSGEAAAALHAVGQRPGAPTWRRPATASARASPASAPSCWQRGT